MNPIIAVIIAIISILLLLTITAFMVIRRPRLEGMGLLFYLYLFNLITESMMLIAALNAIRNHMVANIHTLVSGVMIAMVVRMIWNRMAVKNLGEWVIPVISIFFILAWVMDNFVIHSISTFNPLSQAIISMINLCMVVYLLNVLLFMRSSDAIHKAYLYVVVGLLVYCFNNILIDSFFNMYLKFSESFYDFVGLMVQIIGAVSHFFILLGVIWISRARKYSLR